MITPQNISFFVGIILLVLGIISSIALTIRAIVGISSKTEKSLNHLWWIAAVGIGVGLSLIYYASKV